MDENGVGSPCRMRGSQKDRGLETREGSVGPQIQLGVLRTGETEAWGAVSCWVGGWDGGGTDGGLCLEKGRGRHRRLLNGEQPPSHTNWSRFKRSGVHLGPSGSEGKRWGMEGTDQTMETMTTPLCSARNGHGHSGSLRSPSPVALVKTQRFGVVSRCPVLL